MDAFLGIDAGTTNVKALLLDGGGALLAARSAPVSLMRPFPGASEIDMGALWAIVASLTAALRQDAPGAFSALRGVGVCAQGDGLWAITEGGEPAGPAILWNDTRASGFPDIDMAGLDEYLVAQSSTALFPGALPMILKWLSLNDQGYYRRIHRAAHAKDWLNFRLTGRFVSDCTDFSTAGIDIFRRQHVTALYDKLHIPEAAAMLPELVDTRSIIGTVSAAAARETGIPEGTPVSAGVMDVISTALGAGVSAPGDGCIILGTTLCNEILLDETQVDITDRRGSTLNSVYPGRYLRVMAALSGTSTVDWAKGVLAPELSFEELAAELTHIPPGSRGILYQPYIAGERAPFRNPFACGGFHGLTVRHTRFDMLRAVYEGMALSIRDCFSSLPAATGKLYLSGGGARSGFTCGLVASALSRPVYRLREEDLAARGAVRALKLALGMSDGVETGAAEEFLPCKEETAAFDRLFPQFVGLQSAMGGFWEARRAFL